MILGGIRQVLWYIITCIIGMAHGTNTYYILLLL